MAYDTDTDSWPDDDSIGNRVGSTELNPYPIAAGLKARKKEIIRITKDAPANESQDKPRKRVRNRGKDSKADSVTQSPLSQPVCMYATPLFNTPDGVEIPTTRSGKQLPSHYASAWFDRLIQVASARLKGRISSGDRPYNFCIQRPALESMCVSGFVTPAHILELTYAANRAGYCLFINSRGIYCAVATSATDKWIHVDFNSEIKNV